MRKRITLEGLGRHDIARVSQRSEAWARLWYSPTPTLLRGMTHASYTQCQGTNQAVQIPPQPTLKQPIKQPHQGAGCPVPHWGSDGYNPETRTYYPLSATTVPTAT